MTPGQGQVVSAIRAFRGQVAGFVGFVDGSGTFGEQNPLRLKGDSASTAIDNNFFSRRGFAADPKDIFQGRCYTAVEVLPVRVHRSTRRMPTRYFLPLEGEFNMVLADLCSLFITVESRELRGAFLSPFFQKFVPRF